jgi:hypothetical protein
MIRKSKQKATEFQTGSFEDRRQSRSPISDFEGLRPAKSVAKQKKLDSKNGRSRLYREDLLRGRFPEGETSSFLRRPKRKRFEKWLDLKDRMI